jgi:glyoxylase-like metal-dependent hydrolase (beta-lactamase superfamily II)
MPGWMPFITSKDNPMIEVIPGIYQIQLPLSGYPTDAVNIYLVQGKKSWLLIDAGFNTDAALNSLQKQLNEIGIGLDDIKRVIATHCHHDHYDMTARLKKIHGARIHLHKAGVPILRARSSGHKFLAQLDAVLRRHGMPDSELAKVFPVIPDISPPVMPDVQFDGGEVSPAGNFNLQVIWTPGHTPGQISLYEPKRKLLFCSDLVLPSMLSSTSMHLQYHQNPLHDYVNSLNTIKKLEVKLALPGHENIFSNLSGRIDEILQQRLRKNQRILKTMADGKCRSAYEIAIDLAHSSSNNSNLWTSLNPMDRRFTVSETISHLEALRYAHQMDQTPINSHLGYCLPRDQSGTGVAA